MVTLCCNVTMSKVENRRARLRMLIDAYGLSQLADKTGKPASQLSDMAAGRKSFGEKIADQLTEKTGLPSGWFDLWVGDAPHESPTPPSPAAEVERGVGEDARSGSGTAPTNNIGASTQSVSYNPGVGRNGKLNIERGPDIEAIHDLINSLADKNRLDVEAIAALTALLQLIDSKKDQ